MVIKKCSIESEKTTSHNGGVSGSFIYVRHPFNNRSHAEQEMNKMTVKGLISNYRIAWDTQLRMTVEVIYTDKCCDYEMHRRFRDEVGHWKCRSCGMLL